MITCTLIQMLSTVHTMKKKKKQKQASLTFKFFNVVPRLESYIQPKQSDKDIWHQKSFFFPQQNKDIYINITHPFTT